MPRRLPTHKPNQGKRFLGDGKAERAKRLRSRAAWSRCSKIGKQLEPLCCDPFGQHGERPELLIMSLLLILIELVVLMEHILILGQHEIGISTQHMDIIGWWEDTISYISRVTDRKIKFRPHPNQTKFPKGNYQLTEGTTIEEDLENCWCAVARTTNGAVDAIINGVPVITPDPACMAFGVSSHFLTEILEPCTPDRSQWLYDLAYSQWNIEEMKSGLAWSHIRKFIGKKARDFFAKIKKITK